ncbi:unnamed protein product [Rangifer tarandus platyrhynchus]|uniref:Uncharacterized protein n=1 Tax=Rangifer tarandus platyrhynchus TaxID=3082113 RepID=A0ABN8Y5X6_RANTA|nr:unnamed protein product [Rangifer tarandus platyrhynchus]
MEYSQTKLCVQTSKVLILGSSMSKLRVCSPSSVFIVLRNFKGHSKMIPHPNVHFSRSKGNSSLLTEKDFVASSLSPKCRAPKKSPFLKQNLRILLQNWFKKKQQLISFQKSLLLVNSA